MKNQHLWGRRDPWEEEGIMEQLEPSSIGFWVKSHFLALHSVTCLVTSPTSVSFSVLWCPLQERLSFSSKEFLESEWWGESLDKSSSTLSWLWPPSTLFSSCDPPSYWLPHSILCHDSPFTQSSPVTPLKCPGVPTGYHISPGWEMLVEKVCLLSVKDLIELPKGD